VSPAYTVDRSLSADIEAVAALVNDGWFTQFGHSILPSYAT
jgi:hypothetical protein